MNDELDRVWQDAIVICARNGPCRKMQGLRKTIKNVSEDAGHPHEIRMGRLPNTSLKRYVCNLHSVVTQGTTEKKNVDFTPFYQKKNHHLSFA